MTTLPKKSVPRKHSAQMTREKLLASAHELFDKHGYAVGLRTIAERAGLSTGALASHWPDKASLWAEVYGSPYVDPETRVKQLREVLEKIADASGVGQSLKYDDAIFLIGRIHGMAMGSLAQ